MSVEESLYERAKSFRELYGIFCVPCHVYLGKQNKKDPVFPDAVKGSDFDKPEDWIDKSGKPYTGIAIDTGKSGLTTVDVDVSGGKDGWAGLEAEGIDLRSDDYYTPMESISRSKGSHFFYRQGDIPVADSQSALARDVDIKSGGLVFIAPTKLVGTSQQYKWHKDMKITSREQIPVFPQGLAERLAVRKVKHRAPRTGFTSADVTDAQLEWALDKIDQLLAKLAKAEDGKRDTRMGETLPRIIGLVKTIGHDVEPYADKILAAYVESGGTEEKHCTDFIESAIRYAQPEDPGWWIPEERARSFWDERPELRHIWQVARDATASEWAVLAAVCVRLLADVPPSWVMDTGIGPAPNGNLNMFVVLTSASGGGKGLASETAEYLWPCDPQVYITDAASGEGVAKLFAGRDAMIRNSAIIDVDEYAALKTTADRSGSTLSYKLSTGWSGKRLSGVYSDGSKNYLVEPGCYRLGLIAGVQYGNARMLLSAQDQIQGYANRFLWFPAEIDYDTSQVVQAGLPARIDCGVEFSGDRVIAVPSSVQRTIRAARSGVDNGLDGHKLYAQAKLAYALAVLNGNPQSIREDDWELATVAMEVSTRTRLRARAAMDNAADQSAESRGKADGIRQSVADETVHDRAVKRVARWITRKREEFPDKSDGAIRQNLAGRDNPFWDEALELAIS